MDRLYGSPPVKIINLQKQDNFFKTKHKFFPTELRKAKLRRNNEKDRGKTQEKGKEEKREKEIEEEKEKRKERRQKKDEIIDKKKTRKKKKEIEEEKGKKRRIERRKKKEVKVKNVVKCNFLFFASDNHFFSFVYIVILF